MTVPSLKTPLPGPNARAIIDRDKAVVFWLPGINTWRRIIWSAGYDDVRRHGRFKMQSTESVVRSQRSMSQRKSSGDSKTEVAESSARS